MLGSKAYKTIARKIGGEASEDIVKAAAKNLGYETTQKMVKPLNGMVNVDEIANVAKGMMSKGVSSNALGSAKRSGTKAHNIKNATEVLGTRAPKVRRELDGLRRDIKMDDLEEAFNGGITLGSKNNNIIVDKSSDLVGKYEKELAKNPNNTKAAVKNTTKVGEDPAKIATIEKENRARQELIDKNRKHTETTRNRIEQREAYHKKVNEEKMRTRKEIEDTFSSGAKIGDGLIVSQDSNKNKRYKEIEGAFSSGTKIGDGLIVPQDGNMHKQYKNLKYQGLSNEDAVKKIIGDKQAAREAAKKEEKKVAEDALNAFRERMDYEKLVGKYPNTKEGMKKLKGKKDVDKDFYMKHKTAKQFKQLEKDMKNKDFNSPLWEVFKDEGYNPKKLTQEQFDLVRARMINQASGKDMGVIDTLGFYKVPQKTVAVGGTAWLVSNLASSKGQQSNSQLYGQGY